MIKIGKIIRAKIEYVLFRTGFFVALLIRIRCRFPIFSKKKIVKIAPLGSQTKKYVYKKHIQVSKIKSLVIFAAYIPDKIPQHTIYYLKKLNKIFDGIIFISDSYIQESEIKKIQDLVIYCECLKHCEYDFGSYKRGYNYAKKNGLLDNVDRLLLCNDSVAGPVFDLKDVFNCMTRKTDFWGLMESEEIRYHIQSWFLCFENKRLINNELNIFLNSVKKEKYFWDIVLNYETKLTKALLKSGYTCASYTPSKIKETKKYEILNHSGNKVFYPLIMMQKYNFPFIKIKYLNGEYDTRTIDPKDKTLEYIKQNNNELFAIIKEDFFN